MPRTRRGAEHSHALWDGLAVDIVKKSIKHMYIRVRRDGTISLSQPKGVPEEEARRFLLSHRAWIEEKRSEIATRPVPAELQYTTGETCYLWGEMLTLVVQYGRRHTCAIREGERLVLHVRQDVSQSRREERKAALDAFYRMELMRQVEAIRVHCELVVGKRALSYRTKRMKTKWGVCNITKRRIWLNLELAKCPTEALEYILYHELTHLHERLHNARFHGLMDAFCPDWRERKNRLNQAWGMI